jgi:hypothetical protein
MRRFVQFLLLGGLLAIPAVAQRGGDGFDGQRVFDPGYYGYGYTPSVPAAPTKVTDYRGPGLICPQTNGKPLYRVAIPAGKPGQYQNNIWVAHDYSYTNGILNFVTQEGEQKQTPVSSIDSAITLQLNRECGLNFQFPK